MHTKYKFNDMISKSDPTFWTGPMLPTAPTWLGGVGRACPSGPSRDREMPKNSEKKRMPVVREGSAMGWFIDTGSVNVRDEVWTKFF